VHSTEMDDASRTILLTSAYVVLWEAREATHLDTYIAKDANRETDGQIDVMGAPLPLQVSLRDGRFPLNTAARSDLGSHVADAPLRAAGVRRYRLVKPLDLGGERQQCIWWRGAVQVGEDSP
jgi:hypothetical protein